MVGSTFPFCYRVEGLFVPKDEAGNSQGDADDESYPDWASELSNQATCGDGRIEHRDQDAACNGKSH